MRALVTGAEGMLAGDLIPRLGECGHEVFGLPRRELDITIPDTISRAVAHARPDVVYNCAAYNLVDLAESEAELAESVNGQGVQNLCAVCLEHDIPLVHFSTDYVFDGTKDAPYHIDDEPHPISSYGRSKRSGERFVTSLLTKYYVVRTSWLFGRHGRNFVDTILARAREGHPLKVVDSERGSPTWTRHLAEAVVDLVDSGRHGIYHITNSDSTTWYGLAAEALRLANLEVSLSRMPSGESGRAARRPTNSVLDPRPLVEVLGRPMPTWKRALRDYLENTPSRSAP